MLKFLKIAVFCLVVTCIILGCLSCNKANENDAGGSNAQADTESDIVTRVDKINIKLDDKYAGITIAIRRDPVLSGAIKDFAKSYADTVGAISVTPESRVEYNAEKAEILVGDVGYPESDEVYKTLKYNEVRICVVGSKLVVAGYDSEAMS